MTLALKQHFKFLNPWAPTKYEFNQLISGFWRNIHFSSFVMASSSWLIRFEIVSHWESYSCRVSRSIYKRLPWHYSDVMSNWLTPVPKIHWSICCNFVTKSASGSIRIFLNTDKSYLESVSLSKWRGQSIRFSILVSGHSIVQTMARIYLILVQAIFLFGKSDLLSFLIYLLFRKAF